MEIPITFSFSGTPVIELAPTSPTVTPPPTAVVPNDAGTVRYEHFDDRFLRWGDERDQLNWELAFKVLRDSGELEDANVLLFLGERNFTRIAMLTTICS